MEIKSITDRHLFHVPNLYCCKGYVRIYNHVMFLAQLREENISVNKEVTPKQCAIWSVLVLLNTCNIIVIGVLTSSLHHIYYQ